MFKSALALIFSFHVLLEPTNLDPQTTSSASGNYLLFNLHRALMKYSEEKGLEGEGARSCQRKKPLTVVCELRVGRKWSNGVPITAADYVAAFRRLIDPANASPQSDVLFTVKNAMAIWKGAKEPSELAVFADDNATLRIELETEDGEFEYKLIHPALSPLPPGGYLPRDKAETQVTSGPYSVAEWKSGSWIVLKNNPHYSPHPRPPVKIFFVEDDATAMRLYESGKMSFLRRVTAEEIPRWRRSPEFRQIHMARFDYIGFGPALADKPKLREALVKAVDFGLFHKLFDTRSPPGCPSLPARLMDKVVCQKFNAKAAKKIWSEARPGERIEFGYSMMGGDDIARAAQWFQGQWKKNLGTEVELKPQEQGLYLKRLKAAPPALFRKGVNLDRPTCLGALELFLPGHPDNYIRLDDRRFKVLVDDLARAKTPAGRKTACRKAVEHLLATHRMIPLGEMHFSILAKPEFTGWTLNSLNQLDLAGLTARPGT